MNPLTGEALARITAAAQKPGTAVLLVDLDNLGLPAQGYAHAHLSAILDAVRAACAEARGNGGVDVLVAAGRDHAYDAFNDACAELGITAFEAPPVANGADLELLRLAEDLSAVGVRDFYVASGDHAFTRLPGTVRVVMPLGRQVSAALQAAADDIVWVEVPRPRRSRSSASRARRRAAAKYKSNDQ